jgi:hypothetical protein
LKRMLGCSYKSPMVQQAMKTWEFNVACGSNDEILLLVGDEGETRSYRPWELIAKLLLF